MRIAYIISSFPKASETFVSREVLALQERGIVVEVFSCSAPSAVERARLTPAVRDLAESVHYLSARELLEAAAIAPAELETRELNERLTAAIGSRPSPRLRLLRAVAMGRAIQRGRFDRVHAHWPYGTQLALLVHAMTRLPVSASVHAHEVVHDNRHFPCAFERLEFATFCNRAAMDKLLSMLPADTADRCYSVYHGVDLKGFALRPMPAIDEGLRLYSAGRLSATKGFDRLIKVIAAARDAGFRANLTIAGEGPERAALERLVASLRLEDRVSLPGWVSHDRMSDLAANSHVFALLADCEFHDGLPNVALEAMATGRPVLLSPLPAASEAILPGETGFVLSRPDATEEALSVLRDLTSDTARLASIGAAGRARVEAQFDQTGQIDRLVDLFHGCSWPRRRTGDEEPKLSVVTITKNEERDLPYFLESFGPWVEEVVICDDGSTDRTEAIARAFGPKLKFLQSPRADGEGFDTQRNKAIALATGDWLLHVDADMRLTAELAREIRASIRDASKDVWTYRRANYVLNRPIFHVARDTIFPWLVRRGLGRFVAPVHEKLEIDVPASRWGHLQNRMHHLGDDDFQERLLKNARYSLLESQNTLREKSRTTLLDALVRPPYRAFRAYLGNGGVLDGKPGLFWALYVASSSINRYLLEYSYKMRRDRDELDRSLLGTSRQQHARPGHGEERTETAGSTASCVPPVSDRADGA